MNPNAVIRVLLADPHPVVREGLASVLARQSDMECVGETSSGQETLRRFCELRPDVLVMEMHFSDMDGKSLLTSLRTRFPSACILVLTLQMGEETIYEALQAGAKGYYFKDASLEAIVAAIRTVHGGKAIFAKHVAEKLTGRLQTKVLTPREREVLLSMAQGHSNQEIGNSLFISEGTVKAHANSIYSKLSVSDRTQAVVVAIRRGLVPAPDEWET